MRETFRSLMEKTLYNNGMFEEQAKAIMDVAEKHPSLESMKGRWNDSPDGYPKIMTNIVYLSVKQIAADWIKENEPNAWFRPMFDDKAAKELEKRIHEAEPRGILRVEPAKGDQKTR